MNLLFFVLVVKLNVQECCIRNILEIFTGQNEVSAKVIFSQACVMNSVHGGGCSKFGGGCLLGGCLFFGGGGSSKFSGGVFFLRGCLFLGGGLHRNTVNVRPVRILLECILVLYDSTERVFI